MKSLTQEVFIAEYEAGRQYGDLGDPYTLGTTFPPFSPALISDPHLNTTNSPGVASATNAIIGKGEIALIEPNGSIITSGTINNVDAFQVAVAKLDEREPFGVKGWRVSNTIRKGSIVDYRTEFYTPGFNQVWEILMGKNTVSGKTLGFSTNPTNTEIQTYNVTCEVAFGNKLSSDFYDRIFNIEIDSRAATLPTGVHDALNNDFLVKLAYSITKTLKEGFIRDISVVTSGLDFDTAFYDGSYDIVRNLPKVTPAFTAVGVGANVARAIYIIMDDTVNMGEYRIEFRITGLEATNRAAKDDLGENVSLASIEGGWTGRDEHTYTNGNSYGGFNFGGLGDVPTKIVRYLAPPVKGTGTYVEMKEHEFACMGYDGYQNHGATSNNRIAISKATTSRGAKPYEYYSDCMKEQSFNIKAVMTGSLPGVTVNPAIISGAQFTGLEINNDNSTFLFYGYNVARILFNVENNSKMGAVINTTVSTSVYIKPDNALQAGKFSPCMSTVNRVSLPACPSFFVPGTVSKGNIVGNGFLDNIIKEFV